MVKPVTLVYAYYRNRDTLRRHVETWHTFPDDLKANLRAIIVDDGSPERPAVEALADLSHPFPIKLFRIEQDVRWNWIGARNVGMKEAREGWHLTSDIDHFVNETLARALIYGEHDPTKVYKFARREHTGEKIKPHSNSYFLTREMYWRIGGHDESFSGFYGSDGDHRRRVERTAPVVMLADELIRYEYVGDSSTVVYERKTPADAAHRARVLAARQPGWKPKVLSFAYHEVAL
jgi:hypothetical protein